MKTLEIKVMLNEKGMGVLTNAKGFGDDNFSKTLQIIGILEDLKQKELNKIKVGLSKTDG